VRWVVVGAGTAGSVVAGRLAAAGNHVTVVEAGWAVPPVLSLFDAMAFPGALFKGPVVRGRGLGGSGAVNGMLMAIGDRDQYRAWGWDDVDDALARVRVPMTAATQLGAVDRALLAASPDAAAAVLAMRDGRRVTAADAYLRDVEVTIVSGVEARRIVLDGDRATAVRLADGRTIGADAVAVAAGAVGSPALLRASGLDVGAEPRNHAGLALTLRLRPDVVVDVHGLVTGAALRRDGVEITSMNHLGPDVAGHGMLLAVELVPGALAGGRALLTELLATSAFDAVVAEAVVDEEAVGVHHLTSTLPMGSTVDADGLVAGFANVHVVDASVFPDVPWSGTYLPTLVLAERLAARLVER
jgi:choline dehydrogenase-like flavoprotein